MADSKVTGALGVSQPSLSKADAITRLWMAGLLLYFIVIRDALIVLLLFVGSELAGALQQFWALHQPDIRHNGNV